MKNIIDIKSAESAVWENVKSLIATYEFMGAGIGLVCIGYKLCRYASYQDRKTFASLI